uniref:Uncharacterized protein n=1 Tax=Arundo donax TaxID=35708 RepID=A0A0A9DRB5_ARUDO
MTKMNSPSSLPSFPTKKLTLEKKIHSAIQMKPEKARSINIGKRKKLCGLHHIIFTSAILSICMEQMRLFCNVFVVSK